MRTSKTVGIWRVWVLLLAAVSVSAAADTMQLVEQCEVCHGKDGASTEPTLPTIGGYSALYTSDAMTAYRNQERPCPETEYPSEPRKGEKTDMCKIAADVSEDEALKIAEYFAGKPFVRAKQEFDPDKAEHGKKIHDANCKKCHEDGGSSPDDDAGILAGQWIPYLEHQFKYYSSGERPMPEKMTPKYETLSAEDIEAIIHYFASFQ